MKTHLEEREITAAVAGLELEPAAEEHLGACLSCRRQVFSIRDVIDGRRHRIEAEAPNWERQRQEIMLRLPASPAVRRFRWSRPLLAVAAVLLLAIGLRALWAPAPAGEPAATTELPVEQILSEVDAMLADDSIPGLEIIDPGMEDPQTVFDNPTS
jgi:hypothetical protein